MTAAQILDQYKLQKRLHQTASAVPMDPELPAELTVINPPQPTATKAPIVDSINEVAEANSAPALFDSQPLTDQFNVIPVATTYVPSSTILYRATDTVEKLPRSKKFGFALIFLALGAMVAVAWPFIKLEAGYMALSAKDFIAHRGQSEAAVSDGQESKPDLNPLVAPDGNPIVPVNNDFSLVIPEIGVNTSIIPGVSPLEKYGYLDALKKGVAHSSTSFYPNENGTVYLFSHSTNYEWFVDDLNAVFYLLKNLEPGDYVVVMYLGDRYTYTIRDKQVVPSKAVNYLSPQAGTPNLILQTCYPPGTAYQRLLFFADLVEVKEYGKFQDLPI